MTPEQEKEVKRITEAVKAELKKNPKVEDAEFMLRTEVSEAQYKKGMVLPGSK